MKKANLLAVALAMAVLLLPATASAVEYGGVGGRPANPQPNNPRTQSIFIYQLKPGQQTTDSVKVYNNTDKQRTISLGAVDSVLASGGAFSCAQEADPKNDVGSWIKLQSANLVLPAYGSQKVPFTITAPSKVDVGEHDGCITIQDTSTAPAATGKSGVLLSFRSAIRVVVTVPGKIVKKLSLASVSISKEKNGNYLIAPTAQNEGNVSLDTKVTTTLKSLFGTVVGKQQGGTYPVLPRAKASWNFEVKQPFWGGWYQAHVTATYNNSPTAQLGTQQGPTKTIELASSLFFVSPKPIAVLTYALVLLGIAAIVGWFVRKQRDIRHIRQNWEDYIVEESDTITELAKLRHTSWRKIARVNKLKPPYTLHKGQTLTLPPPKSTDGITPQQVAHKQKRK